MKKFLLKALSFLFFLLVLSYILNEGYDIYSYAQKPTSLIVQLTLILLCLIMLNLFYIMFIKITSINIIGLALLIGGYILLRFFNPEISTALECQQCLETTYNACSIYCK